MSHLPQAVIFKTVGQTELKLHRFEPASGIVRPSPAIVFFFGGSWIKGSPVQFLPHSYYLASRGMQALCAEYRVFSRDGVDPFTCLSDAKSALRWVRKNASSLGLDPQRIVAAGGSAGGHLAAATDSIADFDDLDDDLTISPRPYALALFNPVIDNGPGGYGYERIGERYRSFSPLHNLRSDAAPTAIFLGTQDHLVPRSTGEAYRDRMHNLGRTCELHLYEGQGHGFFNYRDGTNAYFYRTLEALDRFLTVLNLLPAPVGNPEAFFHEHADWLKLKSEC